MKTFAFLALFVSLSSALTSDEYETVRQAFFSQIKKNYKTIDVATVLRLSFHDCVSGCDGCVNVNNEHNAGLDLAVEILENVYQDVEADGIVITRGDLWAIAGRAAAEYGMPGMPGHEDWNDDDYDWSESVESFVSPFPTFKYGRPECDTTPYTTETFDFPTAHMNHDEVYDYFAETFGFDDNQTTIIMGAHTYGRCALENSGYHGPWVLQDGRTTFDNAYYENIIAADSLYYGVDFAEDGATGDDARPMYRCKVADTGANCGNMLVSDFALPYEFEVDDTTRFINCDVSGSALTCDKASTYDLVEAYSQDNDLWISVFVEVYDMMTANGVDSLTSI